MKTTLIIYNSRSGHGRIETCIDSIAEVFAAARFEVRLWPVRFDANPFVECPTPDLAVVCGGDGTVNYALNSMKACGADIPIGVIPAGTANDFARAIGMHSDLVEAARQIAGGRIERLDCGRANGQYFVNVFSFGLFTTTSQHTSDERKHRFGKAAYIAEGLKELRRRRAIPLNVRALTPAGEWNEWSGDAMMMLIFNGETAGGFRLARQASVSDGLFDCALLENRPLPVAAAAALMYLLNGRPNFAIRHIRTSHMLLRSPLAPATDADGQQGAHFPLDIECIRGGMSVVCPAARAGHDA